MDIPYFADTDESLSFPEWLTRLPGDRLLSIEVAPFERPENPYAIAELLPRFISPSGMPIASRALDHSLGEGLYEAEFGRDALIMAAFVHEWMPEVTLSTVIRLAEVQGVKNVARSTHVADLEELGRIPHEIREDDDPLAAVLSVQHGWDWPYFGAVDATILFVSAVARAARNDDAVLTRIVRQRDDVERTLLECLERAVAWIQARLDADPNGLMSTRAATNGCWQVWQDSSDAYHHHDGALASGWLAPLEIQAWCFDALVDAADLYLHLGRQDEGETFRLQAHHLRRATLDKLWLAEDRYFAAGLERNDRTSRRLRVRTANMGLLLASHMLDGDDHRSYVEGIAEQLIDETHGLRCPSGIRTLSSLEYRFRPGAYQNGAVWPWQNLMIADGLRRHGFEEVAADIEDRMVGIVNAMGCFPEYVQGGDTFAQANEASVWMRSDDGRGGTYLHQVIQPAQKYQGWTAYGIYALERRRVSKKV